MRPWTWLRRLLRAHGLRKCRRGEHAVRALVFVEEGSRTGRTLRDAIASTWHRTSCPHCGRGGWAFALEPGWLEIVSLAPGRYRIEKRDVEGR